MIEEDFTSRDTSSGNEKREVERGRGRLKDSGKK